jgi:hypothetical protein
MIPFEQRQTVEVLYQTFSKDHYNTKLSWILPNEFVLDPLFQTVKQEYVNDIILEEKSFILAGPEFNNL